MALLSGPGALQAKLMIPRGSSSWEIKDVIKKGDFDNVLLLSFAIGDQEIVDIRQCFDETVHIFAFGRNAQGCVMEVSLLMFLYDGCEKYTWATLDDIRERYNKNRVYKLQKAVQITIDGLTVNGFLVKMSVSDVNPAIKACVVSFTFIMDQEA